MNNQYLVLAVIINPNWAWFAVRHYFIDILEKFSTEKGGEGMEGRKERKKEEMNNRTGKRKGKTWSYILIF